MVNYCALLCLFLVERARQATLAQFNQIFFLQKLSIIVFGNLGNLRHDMYSLFSSLVACVEHPEEFSILCLPVEEPDLVGRLHLLGQLPRQRATHHFLQKDRQSRNLAVANLFQLENGLRVLKGGKLI
jgi:hypothetical protein